MLTATVVIPTHNHGRILWYAAQSALNQTVRDVEVFIVGDGVTPPTRETAQELVKSDARVQFLEFPKAPRTGEVSRHQALQAARGHIVCYLSDDDLWLPNHVEIMLELTRRADFVHGMPLWIEVNGTLGGWAVDLAQPLEREQILKTNRIPLSCGAHTMELYRRLPYGWRTAPEGVFTDHYMWQQILNLADCRAASSTRPTVLIFPSPARRHMTIEERCTELERWADRLADQTWSGRFVYNVLDYFVRNQAAQVSVLQRDNSDLRRDNSKLLGHNSELQGHYVGLVNTPWWKLRDRLLGLPVLGTLLKWAARLVWRQGSR